MLAPKVHASCRSFVFFHALLKVPACVTDILFLYSVFSLSKVSWFNLPCYFQVAWYRLFARSASGNNVKVRLNDYQLPGTGEEVFVHDI